MFKDIGKATLLEVNFIKENKINLLLFFILPAFLVYLFGVSTQMNIPWLEGDISYFDFYSPVILPIILLFVIMQLVVLRIVGERAPYGTLDRDLLAISRTGMFFGKFLANSIIAISQSIIIFIISIYVFGVRVVGNNLFVLIFLILISLMSLALGLLISVFSKTREQAIQIVPFIAILFLIFNGTMIKLESMPAPVKMIASNLPLTLTTEALNKIMVYAHGLQQLIPDIIKMSVWVLILIFVGWIKFLSEKKINKDDKIIKRIFVTLFIASILAVFFLSVILFFAPNWEKMTINDFQVDRVTDEWGTYPYVTYMNDILPFIKHRINFADSIKDSRRYIWSLQGQYIEGSAIILKMENTSVLKEINENGTSLDKYNSSGEEVYFYSKKMDYRGYEQEITVHIWDEDRFIFIVLGQRELCEKIIKKIVNGYPVKPKQNNIKPSKEQIENLIDSFAWG